MNSIGNWKLWIVTEKESPRPIQAVNRSGGFLAHRAGGGVPRSRAGSATIGGSGRIQFGEWYAEIQTTSTGRGASRRVVVNSCSMSNGFARISSAPPS